MVSSQTYLVDKPNSLGIRVGMSQLVANMLESLLYLWKLKFTPEHVSNYNAIIEVKNNICRKHSDEILRSHSYDILSSNFRVVIKCINGRGQRGHIPPWNLNKINKIQP